MPQDHEETATMPDPIHAGTAIQRRHARAPRYDVYRYSEDNALGTGIDAKNDREAVRIATADLPEDEKYGQFLVGLEGQMRLLTREKKVIPETIADDWK